MRVRPAAAALIALLVAVLTAPAAVADVSTGSLRLEIEDLTAQPDGTTTVTVNVAGLPPGTSVDPSNIEIVENGVAVQDVGVGAVEEVAGQTRPPAVVVAIDTSGSLTEDDGITAAKDAATQLVRDITADGGLVAVVSFADEVVTEQDLTSDGDAAAAAIADLAADGATALYDGISRAVRIASAHDGPHDVVVFTDGEDNGSSSGLDDVRALLADSLVPVTSVRLVTEGGDDSALDAIAAVSEGAVIRVSEVSGLAGAFEAISADLRNRVQLSWTAEPSTERPNFLNIVATYRDEAGVASDGAQLENPRFAEVTPPRPVTSSVPVVQALATPTVLYAATAAVAAAVLLIAFVVLASAGQRRRAAHLDRRLSVYEHDRDPTIGPDGRPIAQRSLSSRAADVVDQIPRPSTFDERLAARIEQADWPMRVSEFLLLVLVAGVSMGVLVAVLSAAPWWLSTVTGLIGFVLPFMILRLAVSRRQKAFADQLPDVLQVIGGALRAGHAFSTAVDGAVGEVDEPASSELRRASVEARLGRPMDKALLGVADRMDSVDLTWVVSALAVQREVGGNLAEVLDNVAGTLRSRASVRRQVQALSAEGRLSANIISAMPFVMFLVLTVISPDYIAILFQRPIGRLIILAGLLLLAAGIVWLRRLVKPQF